jgi:hypothetical protein
MINVYDRNPEFDGPTLKIIARVKLNTRLDYWDGNNNTNGGIGMHKGITKLKKPQNPDKPYVLIISSQWQGEKSYAYCVDAEKAVTEILRAGSEEDHWVWPELKEIIRALEDSEE